MLDYHEQYRPSPLESAVVDFYRKHQIKSPQDINLEMYAYDAGIWVHIPEFQLPT